MSILLMLSSTKCSKLVIDISETKFGPSTCQSTLTWNKFLIYPKKKRERSLQSVTKAVYYLVRIKLLELPNLDFLNYTFTSWIIITSTYIRKWTFKMVSFIIPIILACPGLEQCVKTIFKLLLDYTIVLRLIV
jgi:hypothetical protein